MAIRSPLSPKLALLRERGYALRGSRDPDYACEWHTHDCAMLLWPQTGGLRSAWVDPDQSLELSGARTALLARRHAVLLQPATAHCTRSTTARQQHGELYLAPELLGAFVPWGALRLDASLLAMLDALLAPATTARSSQHLVQAIVAQLQDAPRVPVETACASVAQRFVQAVARTLDFGGGVPAIEAIAAELGVSMRQLQRACERELGTSPLALRRRLVAAWARRRLAEGGSLAQVSAELGFASSGHLGRLLRALD
jgi:AraC-like DNA-binding protein